MSGSGDSRDGRGDELKQLRTHLAGTAGGLSSLDEALGLVLENWPDNVTVMDADGTILYLNWTGPDLTREGVIGTNACDYIPAAQRGTFRAMLRAAVTAGREQRFETQSVSGRWWETRLVPVVRDGDVIAVMGIGCDITARKELEEQLRQSQKMEAVGRLTAGVAHNFNNILMGILPNIQLCLTEASGQHARRLRDAEDATMRAAEMIRQLMLFARKQPTEHRYIEPLEIVRATLDMCTQAFPPQIEVRFEPPADSPGAVAGDASQLGQALLNICLNARDALLSVDRDGRFLEVELDRVPRGHSALADRADDGDHVRVRVRDNGCGMSAETRERLFEPFFTTKEVGHGTGLGLASAYAIIDEHHGWMTCISERDHGSLFTIFLPVSDIAPSLVDPARLPGGSEVILVVDDKAILRESVSGALSRKGYAVLAGRDVGDAVEIFKRAHAEIDLIILDSASAGDALPGLLAIDDGAKIVLLSHKQSGHPEGAAAVLEKPVSVGSLLTTVRSLLDG